MGPSGRITHVIRYIEYIGYIALFGTGICRFCIWVELLVQRRLCPIFVRNVGSPDIHECFHWLTGSQRTPGFRVSHAPCVVHLPLNGHSCLDHQVHVLTIKSMSCRRSPIILPWMDNFSHPQTFSLWPYLWRHNHQRNWLIQ